MRLLWILKQDCSLDQSELPNERFYKSVVTQCRRQDMNYYRTGTVTNPYEVPLHDKIRWLTSVPAPQNNFLVVPRDFSQLQTTSDTLHAVRKFLLDLSRLYDDVFGRAKKSEKRE